MLSGPTHQDIKNILLMIEVSQRLGKSITLEESLESTSLNFLLTEDVSNEEAEKLDTALEQTRTGLKALLDTIPAGKLPGVRNYFQDQMEKLPTGGEMAKLAIGGDTKGIKKASEKAATAMTQIQAARDSVSNAVQLLGTNLAKLKYSTEGDATKTLTDISGMDEEGRLEFPDEETLRKGMERSFAPSAESKGIFGKIAGWLKGKLGKTLDKSLFVDEMMNLSLEELATMVGAVQDADTAGDASAEIAGEAITGVGDDIGGEGDEAGEEGAEAEEEEAPGAYTITRNDLKTLKGAMDKAKGAKKSQAKALGRTLNGMLGNKVFAENRWYSFGEAEILMERLLLHKSINNTQSYRTQWTTEELAQTRLLRMAGLRDN